VGLGARVSVGTHTLIALGKLTQLNGVVVPWTLLVLGVVIVRAVLVVVLVGVFARIGLEHFEVQVSHRLERRGAVHGASVQGHM